MNARDGVQFVIEAIENNPSLDTFRWVNNPIHSAENVNKLAGAINSLTSPKYIYLEGCCGQNVNGYGLLRSLLSGAEGRNSLTTIDLDSNNISTEGGYSLIRLPCNQPSTSTALLATQSSQ